MRQKVELADVSIGKDFEVWGHWFGPWVWAMGKELANKLVDQHREG